MPIAKCGIQFSWDAPLWCKTDKQECSNCPLNSKHKHKTDE